MIKFIHNIGDFFSSNYFDEDFGKKVIAKTGYATDDVKLFQKKISALKDKYFKHKKTLLERKLRTKDKVTETHKFHSIVLNALGYDANKNEYDKLYHVDEKTVLPIRQTLYRGDQPHLMIMEMQSLIKEGDEEPDGLFEQRYSVEDEETQTPPQKYHRSQWDNIFKVPEGVKISPMIINKAVSQLFLLETHRRPKYVLLCAGNVYYLLEQEKWFRGSYLEFDLESLFDEGAIKRDYYGLFYFLLAKETLAPQSEIVLMDQLDEDSHKSANEVTQDLKEGVIYAVETIANEAVVYLKSESREVKDISAETLKNECLNYVYRLLFLFYAESRDDLDILPSNDEVYLKGYSLEMLRDLEQVNLDTASSQNGFFFHESITRLFQLLNGGYREKDAINRSFHIRNLDSPLFDDKTLEILPNVKLRNLIWRDVICQLSLSRKQKGKARGRISYANLGINQLGSVYESLLAFRGFFAETDYIEVHRKRKAKETSKQVANKEGSYLVPRHRIDDFDHLEVYRDHNDDMKVIPQETFIYRLSGRDRQKSASYYTPEVLTQCTVKYTLKPILEKLDKGKMKAQDLLELKILEPAMGAAAFHNEVINQLADAYLQYRQIELKQKVAPDKYREETQKVKAYIALNNVYGVDLNPTAVELGKLSLWLNVIHKDMQTPFFGYRLGTGNAVVGAWLKVFKPKDFLLDPKKKKDKKEWWTKAPKHLTYSKVERRLQRKEDEVYHFLLPDKGMVPSAGIKLLKAEFAEQAKHVSSWKKIFCAPISGNELLTLKRLSKNIDLLLEEHYKHQRKINQLTSGKVDLFGIVTPELNLESYAEKEHLAKQRLSANAPYFKLKMIMDYWCSLWFWDMREAAQLPTRMQWWQDIANILQVDLNEPDEPNAVKSLTKQLQSTTIDQINLFERNAQLHLGQQGLQKVEDVILEYGNAHGDELFKNQRLVLVKKYVQSYRFFHYQLEFIEVFKERDGFDVIVGNPPWVNIEMDEAGIISEQHPEIAIRKMSAPQVKKKAAKILAANKGLSEIYTEESIWADATKAFLGGVQNYPLLQGQRNNLYKCILTNSFNLSSINGLTGLVHPHGMYEDPDAYELREESYKRLEFNFQFVNTLKLFTEILHWISYDISVYSSRKDKIRFDSISNLYHPSTIDGIYVHDGNGIASGLKIKNENSNSFKWNIHPHKSRLIKLKEESLKVISKLTGEQENWDGSKLMVPFTKELLNAIIKINDFGKELKNSSCKITMCWNQTISVEDNILEEKTDYPNISDCQMVYSGPHFFVGNPMSKSPFSNYSNQSHYDVIQLELMGNDFVQRSNYIPVISRNEIINKTGHIFNKPWIDFYKLGLSKMVNVATERTLQPAILMQNSSHIDGVISIVFEDDNDLIEVSAILSSIVYDFQIKALGKSNIYDNTVSAFKYGVNEVFKLQLSNRALQLNCLNKYYAPLWERNWQEAYKQSCWSKADPRLKLFNTLTKEWQWSTPLRNWYERRQALVEIDVITAMALGLNLEELILIYNVQFPVLQQNEDDTWYDTKGNIVFTCSKGLTGIGVDRSVWENIRHLKIGETYEHTIEKGELYFGKKVIYHGPFDKCDRVEDYKIAWEHFEKVFKNTTND